MKGGNAVKLLKRTYALPSQTLAKFEEVVDSGRRSAVVADLIDDYLEERKREALRRDLDEGCREMWDVYLETAKDWEATDDELHRSIEY
jgi:metal-responsive CopG/Arc/MetJ family transcriptional regulator